MTTTGCQLISTLQADGTMVLELEETDLALMVLVLEGMVQEEMVLVLILFFLIIARFNHF